MKIRNGNEALFTFFRIFVKFCFTFMPTGPIMPGEGQARGITFPEEESARKFN
jgi:hypothetical protein